MTYSKLLPVLVALDLKSGAEPKSKLTLADLNAAQNWADSKLEHVSGWANKIYWANKIKAAGLKANGSVAAAKPSRTVKPVAAKPSRTVKPTVTTKAEPKATVRRTAVKLAATKVVTEAGVISPKQAMSILNLMAAGATVNGARAIMGLPPV